MYFERRYQALVAAARPGLKDFRYDDIAVKVIKLSNDLRSSLEESTDDKPPML